MRSGLVISVLVPSLGLLTACSSVATSAPAAISPSPSPSQSCALALQAWLQGNGGSAFHQALSASSAMRSALKSNSQTSAESQAQRLNSAARRADDHLPPACTNHGRHYQLAMGDWLVGARDATHGNLKATSWRIAEGAQEIDAANVLKRLAPSLLERLSRRIVIAVATPATVPVATSAPPSPAPPSPAPPASATPAGCYPLSDEGTCYEPGEYCRDDDHGVSGIAGDGEAITCEDNDGWRWEPS
jgi:hypothetical protein